MKKEIKTYRDLEAWEEAMKLSEDIYRLTEKLPSSELYGLTSQMRRGSVSIPSNIAEGHARKGEKEFLHHLSIARGSLVELETQSILCVRLGFIIREDLIPIWDRFESIGKLLTGLVRSLSK
jgi:four helix bundle protein